MSGFLHYTTDVSFCKKLLIDVLQVVQGAVQVAKIAVLAGLAAFATDKIHKEYMARKVIIHSTGLSSIGKAFVPAFAFCVPAYTNVRVHWRK